MDKRTARLRRAKSTRAHIRELGVPRLSVLRTGQHVYAQLFSADGSKVLASASTTQTDVRDGLKSNKNIEAAAKVGRAIAEKARAAGVEKVARSEEHTSELQSLMRISYAVFCLKKKTQHSSTSKKYTISDKLTSM